MIRHSNVAGNHHQLFYFILFSQAKFGCSWPLHSPDMSPSGFHSKPIALVPVRARQAADSDFASSIPTPIPLGLYESVRGAGASAHEGLVPSLAYFCIRTLVGYTDQVYSLGSHRISCQPEVLRTLSPSTFDDDNKSTYCLCKLDPRLWSIIIQVYSGLPEGLRNYYIPLGDKYLPLLQAIPSTPYFALITVLNLAGSVSDETSHALKYLHGLCALDISNTSISHLGILHFTSTVTTEPSGPRYGTRGLRILRLTKCRNITDQVIGAVSNFPLLAILGSYLSRHCCQVAHKNTDLRGTSCTQDLNPGVFRQSGKSQRDLFQCSLQDALQKLRDSDSRNILFSHPDPFVIHINTQFHPRWPRSLDRPEPAPAPSATASILQRFHHHQVTMKAEGELREWIRSILGDAANESRISEIVDFVVQRWKYNLEWTGPESDFPRETESDERYKLDSGFPREDDDTIDSWDEENSTESSIEFCGYKIDGDLIGRVRELVDEVLEEHESANRFYGLDSRTAKAAFCHCKKLRGVATSLAKPRPTDRLHTLVRDPPPWNSVYGPDVLPPRKVRLGTKPSLSESTHLYPNRSSARAKKSVRGMLGMITQRSIPTTTTAPSLSFTPTTSKNPFRKDSTRGLACGGSKDPHQRHGDSARGGNSDCAPDGPAPKRMKPISHIPVPPRPTSSATSQSVRAKNPNGGAPGSASKKPGNLKQTTLVEVFGKRT